MSAPVLSRRLTLEGRVAAPDGAGGESAGWVALGEHWASVRPSVAVERALAAGVASLVTHRAVLRWTPYGSASRPRADQRFREGARVFDILGVTEADDRAEHLVAWLREASAA